MLQNKRSLRMKKERVQAEHKLLKGVCALARY
jgi:hypothetical protein